MSNSTSNQRTGRELAIGENLLPVFEPALHQAAPPVQPAPTSFPTCSPPSLQTPPQFVIGLRRPIRLLDVVQYSKENPTSAQITCIPVIDCNVNFGLDPRFEQTWNLLTVTIGDLASTMSLAPGEQLTLEFQNTQRKVFDKSVVDSTESLDSSESTTMDKEAINISRASSKTEGWHVDTTGELTVGYASLRTTVGYSQSVTTSNNQTIDHVTEATKKSAHSLKSLHKIEVRGVSEGLITNRMTRVVKNPYRDRTLSVNVFQLEKHFSVQTALTEVHSALILRVDSLLFDRDFVIANVDFLQNELLDTSLIDDLSAILENAIPVFVQDAQATAGQIARQALHLLFDDSVNMFHMPPVSGANIDANLPSSSFNATLSTNFGDSGLSDAINNDLGIIFTILNYFYILVTRDIKGNVVQISNLDDVTAIQYAVTLGKELNDQWYKEFPDPTKDPVPGLIKNIMDQSQLTEIFRRLSGFLTVVKGMLLPLLEPVQQQQQQQQDQTKAIYVLNRVLKHLACNQNYYIQQYLRYIAAKTNNQAIIDFAVQVLADPQIQQKLAAVLDLDIDRAFIDRREIIIPGFTALDPKQLGALGKELFGTDGSPVANPEPSLIEDIAVPCDGIHLEVAEGACVLKDVPAEDEDELEITIHDASLKVSTSGLSSVSGS